MTLFLNSLASPLFMVFFAVRLGIVIPLAIACSCIVVLVPTLARRGKITIPACVYTGLGAAVLALGSGKLAGVRGVRGTGLGIFVSILFYLLVATAAGSFVGLYFFRRPPEA
jgi:hypothetical protein